VGANLQNNGTGIVGSFDYGLGENISIGAISAYLLGVANGIDKRLPGNILMLRRGSSRI